MRNLLKLMVLASCLNTPLIAATAEEEKANCTTLKGVWVKENGSTLLIKSVDPKSGQISGTYQLPANIDPTLYDLVGWFSANKSKDEKGVVSPLSFSVRWHAFGSISSWIGTCEEVSGAAKLKLITHQVKFHAPVANERITTEFNIFSAK